jgi:hypothetical protein
MEPAAWSEIGHVMAASLRLQSPASAHQEKSHPSESAPFRCLAHRMILLPARPRRVAPRQRDRPILETTQTDQTAQAVAKISCETIQGSVHGLVGWARSRSRPRKSEVPASHEDGTATAHTHIFQVSSKRSGLGPSAIRPPPQGRGRLIRVA